MPPSPSDGRYVSRVDALNGCANGLAVSYDAATGLAYRAPAAPYCGGGLGTAEVSALLSLQALGVPNAPALPAPAGAAARGKRRRRRR